MSAARELLASLVAIPSLSGDEVAIADFLERYLRDRGLPVERDDRNLVVRVRGERPGATLLLNSHVDVVPVGEGWTQDPFVPTVSGDRMVGRGCNDAKASVTAMLLATEAIFRRPPAAGELILALTCEEERGRAGLERILGGLGPIDGALIGEPTQLQPAVAQNGLLILDLIASGRAGHAARPRLAVNALDIAARDVIALHALDWVPTNAHVGAMTLVVTQIQAGHAHNIIPGECRMVVDIRTIPEIAPATVVDRVRAHVASEVIVRSDRLAPARTPAGARILAAVLAALPAAAPFGSPTVSDWAHLKGIPAVKIGPGISEVSHTTDEWVDLAQVDAAVIAYEDVARAFFGSTAPSLA